MALNLNEKHLVYFRGKGNQNHQLWIKIFVEKKIKPSFV
jgi:hypothetical protein